MACVDYPCFYDLLFMAKHHLAFLLAVFGILDFIKGSIYHAFTSTLLCIFFHET